MDISFQNSAISQTNITGELKSEPNNHGSPINESHFTKKNTISMHVNPTEIEYAKKPDNHDKRKNLTLKKSLSKTLSSIVISIRKMF
jgi:hypothetical protein